MYYAAEFMEVAVNYDMIRNTLFPRAPTTHLAVETTLLGDVQAGRINPGKRTVRSTLPNIVDLTRASQQYTFRIIIRGPQ